MFFILVWYIDLPVLENGGKGIYSETESHITDYEQFRIILNFKVKINFWTIKIPLISQKEGCKNQRTMQYQTHFPKMYE